MNTTTLIELSLFVMQSSLSSKWKTEVLLLQQKMTPFSPLTLVLLKNRAILLSVHFEGDPMNASRKSVEEMNTDMNKDDRAIWPDRFCSCSSFFCG